MSQEDYLSQKDFTITIDDNEFRGTILKEPIYSRDVVILYNTDKNIPADKNLTGSDFFDKAKSVLVESYFNEGVHNKLRESFNKGTARIYIYDPDKKIDGENILHYVKNMLVTIEKNLNLPNDLTYNFSSLKHFKDETTIGEEKIKFLAE